jgi:hypothetical protein
MWSNAAASACRSGAPPRPARESRSRAARWLGPRGRSRRGNRFEARTRGVTAFTLLSPDVVDFAAPVVVTVNGRTVHEGPVARDVVRCRRAARDNDRTMLYGAALPVRVP